MLYFCASEGTLSRWSRQHLQSLAPTNPHWARVERRSFNEFDSVYSQIAKLADVSKKWTADFQPLLENASNNCLKKHFRQ
ncbi:hypothetical protein evm_007387 [Chilo suppressalis]|nr:hypothetical protein evm_007387 [Chilo suppressalis]